MASKLETEFTTGLEIFRKDAESATQFFYGYLAIHEVAGQSSDVHRSLNTAPLFWNTNLGALQTATFISLHRIFDNSARHSLRHLLEIAEKNQEIFSKNALALRKQGTNSTPPLWLKKYLQSVHVPKSADFKRLKGHEQKWRTIYQAKYTKIRSQIFAHNVVTDASKVSALFAQTNIREMQNMLAVLRKIYDALWELFQNGRKPILRRQRISVKAMLDSKSLTIPSRSLQERVVREANDFLRSATSKGI